MTPELETAEQEAITQLVRALTEDRQQRKVAYSTEAGLFQRIGIPTVVCGPGDIAQAHKPNEFVAIDQLARCEGFLRKLGHSLTVA
jgi:acetylornithine deacetylase